MNLEALMRALCRRHDGGVADEGIVDSRIGNQVCLELVEVDVEGAVEPEGRGNGADDLGNQAVKVMVRGSGEVEVPTANVVDGLIVDEECAVRVFNGAVGGQDGIVGLDDGRVDARRRIDGELQLGLLAILGSQALQKKGAEAGAGPTSKGMEDQEALKRLAVVCARRCRSALARARRRETAHRPRDERGQ